MMDVTSNELTYLHLNPGIKFDVVKASISDVARGQAPPASVGIRTSPSSTLRPSA